MRKYTKMAVIHGELVPVTCYTLHREENHLNPMFSKTRGRGGKIEIVRPKHT